MKSLILVPALLAVPATARAECYDPGECICTNEPTTILEGVAETGTDGVLRIDVEAVHGAADGHAAGDVFELPPSDFREDPAPGTRVLVHLSADFDPVVASINDDGTMDCRDLRAFTVEEAIEDALSDDCYSRIEGSSACDDTPGCSVGGGSAGALILLPLLGLVARRRR